jgi:hypothetical protein
MVTPGAKKKQPQMRQRQLTGEQKEFILNSLACRQAYWEIQEEFFEEFGVKCPAKQVIAGYKQRYAEEIERRRAAWAKDLKSSGLPFVRQEERIKRYGRFVNIEMRRRRYKDAASHLRAIAEETGDLKHTTDVNLNDVTPRSAEQSVSRLADITTTIIGGAAEGDAESTGGD